MSPTSSSQPPNSAPYPKHRPRRAAVPSTLALATLAFLCADTVSAIPPFLYSCPDFLCPYQSINPTTPAPNPSRHRKRYPSHSPTVQGVPTKFVQGQDGRWRPEPNWSLNGHTTSCSSSSKSSSVPSSDQPIDSGTAEPLDDTSSSIPSNNNDLASGSNETMPTDLPSGWTPVPARSEFYSVRVIVIFSLSLAALIVLLISISAVRRNRARRRKIEEKIQRAEADEDVGFDEDPGVAKQIHRKKRARERSFARWKLSARLTMRRRRGRPSTPSPTIADFADDSDTIGPASSLMDQSTTDNAGRSSAISMENEAARGTPGSSDQGGSEGTRSAPLSGNAPPAYGNRRNLPSSGFNDGAYPHAESSETTRDTDEKSSGSQATHGSETVISSIAGCPPADTDSAEHSGHIATDDKAALARMAASASSPVAPSSSVDHQAIAPPWTEEIPQKVLQESLVDQWPGQMQDPLLRLPSPPPDTDVNWHAYEVGGVQSLDCTIVTTPSAPPGEDEEALPASAPRMEDLSEDTESNVRHSSSSLLPTYMP